MQEWTSSSSGSATPCFSSRPQEPERVGRDGFLKLRFARSGSNTILAQSRFSLPLQALAPLTLADGSSYLMLLNPTGGVLGGDRLVTEIAQEAGTHVCLSTPSATRVYRTVGQPAILDTVIHLGEGATLEYFPDHVIPHAGSALRQSLRMEIAPGSRAILFDSMAAGRVAHGERWNFTEIDSRTDVRVCGRAAYINRTKITPATTKPDRQGLMEGFDYVACMAVFADGFSRWPQLCAALNATIETVPEIRGAATMLARGGCVARFLAHSAPDMTVANKTLWDAAREIMLNLPPFDQRKY
ncbi:MAG TPA: urease accessory protein UreD [Verrucomicrobiae bacterium]|nr:urease accessory protein UreD [Verrucomicrobiae bacterium]